MKEQSKENEDKKKDKTIGGEKLRTNLSTIFERKKRRMSEWNVKPV